MPYHLATPALSGGLLSHKFVRDARRDESVTCFREWRRCGGHGRQVLGQLLLDQSPEEPACSAGKWKADEGCVDREVTMTDIHPGYAQITGSVKLVGDTAFVGNLQYGNFLCANPKISGPYPVACDHLPSITWTIKGQYRTYRNSLEACSRIHVQPPLLPSWCAQRPRAEALGLSPALAFQDSKLAPSHANRGTSQVASSELLCGPDHL
jgi:hypothetical protein